MINLHMKFEVSMLIHYEETKGNAKCGLGMKMTRHAERQTDGQTRDDGIYCANIASRGKNLIFEQLSRSDDRYVSP